MNVTTKEAAKINDIIQHKVNIPWTCLFNFQVLMFLKTVVKVISSETAE